MLVHPLAYYKTHWGETELWDQDPKQNRSTVQQTKDQQEEAPYSLQAKRPLELWCTGWCVTPRDLQMFPVTFPPWHPLLEREGTVALGKDLLHRLLFVFYYWQHHPLPLCLKDTAQRRLTTRLPCLCLLDLYSISLTQINAESVSELLGFERNLLEVWSNLPAGPVTPPPLSLYNRCVLCNKLCFSFLIDVK